LVYRRAGKRRDGNNMVKLNKIEREYFSQRYNAGSIYKVNMDYSVCVI